MKKIVRKAILSVLLILFIITLLVIGYYFVVDIETKEPEEVKAVCELKTENYKDRKVFIISPKEGIKTEQKILYFHGGSYVAEASKEHWKFIEKLVLDTKATIIMPDYPLTPKYHYQDVFAMVEPLYKEIIEKVKPEQLIVMGDSAGGGLGLALLEKVSQEGISMPEKTILISPWLDVRLKNPKIAQVQEQDKELNKETLRLAGIAYSGEEGKDSYLVNPIEGDLSKLKNITIFTGTYDILNPDVYVLKEKAEQVKVKIEVKEYEKARSYMDNSRKK
ncbi:MAG: alpha/beta hydrolase [Clostridia bacterium]|nr:alpha/beta hydrolase [Clostridia bacterium]